MRQKVPGALILLLALVVGTFAWVERGQLERTMMASAGERLETVSQLLATLLAQSAADDAEGLGRLAVRTRLRTYAEGVDAEIPAIRDTLRSVLGRDGEIVSLEVWDATDGCLVGVARSFPLAPDDPSGGPVEAGCADRFPAPALLGPDRAVRPFRALEGRLYSEWVAPIDDSTWLVERRGGSSRESVQLVADLISEDARLFVGNGRGGLWSDFVEVVERPEVDRLVEGPRQYDRPDGGTALGVARPVPGTPWVVWLERDRRVILAPVRAFVGRATEIGLAILAVGALLGWLTSRRLTRPLDELTEGAEAVARGEYGRPVRVDRGDELGRLAEAFNSMAGQVAETREELERRVAQRTRELEDALQSLKEAHEELIRQEKLAFLGQLAGGVSHELRNPLGVMSNAVYYLRRVLDDPPEKVDEYLGVLSSQIRASEKIVGDLLDFARSQSPELEVVDVPAVVRDELEAYSCGPGVTVEKELGNGTPPALADEQQLRQIVRNLVTNADDAMKAGGGVLTVRSRDGGDHSVVLAVEDTGVGIPAGDLENIFEPLFTTKVKGIGLGLTVTRFLAESNGGSLTVESTPDEGSTFTLTLPSASSSDDPSYAKEST